jgi:VWFA-related protein
VLLAALALGAGSALVTLAATAGAPPALAAPPAPPQRSGGFAEEISVAWVLVPVVVRDRSGFVHGLTKGDFHLRVDGRPVPIDSFDSGTETSLSLVFLQDLSGSMAGGGKIDAGRDALRNLISHARDGDEVAVAGFASGRLRVEVPFTRDLEVLEEAMAVWDPYGTTALHDAVAWIPQISDEGRNPKRAVVLVTDGVDNASTFTPEQARNAVQRARLPVYVLGLGAGEPGAARDGSGARVDTYALLLERLARQTGGRYFAVSGPLEAARAVAVIADDLRAQYVLGFPAQSQGPHQYRRFRVTVDGRNREVVHRLGYDGGTPAAWDGARGD